jgi:hypothetical protein
VLLQTTVDSHTLTMTRPAPRHRRVGRKSSAGRFGCARRAASAESDAEVLQEPGHGQHDQLHVLLPMVQGPHEPDLADPHPATAESATATALQQDYDENDEEEDDDDYVAQQDEISDCSDTDIIGEERRRR